MLFEFVCCWLSCAQRMLLFYYRFVCEVWNCSILFVDLLDQGGSSICFQCSLNKTMISKVLGLPFLFIIWLKETQKNSWASWRNKLKKKNKTTRRMRSTKSQDCANSCKRARSVRRETHAVSAMDTKAKSGVHSGLMESVRGGTRACTAMTLKLVVPNYYIHPNSRKASNCANLIVLGVVEIGCDVPGCMPLRVSAGIGCGDQKSAERPPRQQPHFRCGAPASTRCTWWTSI